MTSALTRRLASGGIKDRITSQEEEAPPAAAAAVAESKLRLVDMMMVRVVLQDLGSLGSLGDCVTTNTVREIVQAYEYVSAIVLHICSS